MPICLCRDSCVRWKQILLLNLAHINGLGVANIGLFDCTVVLHTCHDTQLITKIDRQGWTVRSVETAFSLNICPRRWDFCVHEKWLEYEYQHISGWFSQAFICYFSSLERLWKTEAWLRDSNYWTSHLYILSSSRTKLFLMGQAVA
jgi:hypothetical protein